MSHTTAPGDLALVQHLVNTFDVETGQDQLSARGGLRAFAEAHRLSVPGSALEDVVELRELLRSALLGHTGLTVPKDHLSRLTKVLDAAPLVLRIDAEGGAAVAPAPGLSGVPFLTARVAAAVTAGQVDGAWQRLKACEDLGCAFAYYDRSPGGRRRWCSMQVCGARNKMRSYRARQSAGGAAG